MIPHSSVLDALMKLKPGDVIPINDPSMVYVCTDQVKLFKAVAGTAKSQRVVKILDKYK